MKVKFEVSIFISFEVIKRNSLRELVIDKVSLKIIKNEKKMAIT